MSPRLNAIGRVPVIIASIVLFSIALDIFQEQKAENFVEALKGYVAVTLSLLRDGQYVELAVRHIMPGRVIGLRASDLGFQRWSAARAVWVERPSC